MYVPIRVVDILTSVVLNGLNRPGQNVIWPLVKIHTPTQKVELVQSMSAQKRGVECMEYAIIFDFMILLGVVSR